MKLTEVTEREYPVETTHTDYPSDEEPIELTIEIRLEGPRGIAHDISDEVRSFVRDKIRQANGD